MQPSALKSPAAHDAGIMQIPMMIDGQWRRPAETYAVRDPYRGEVV